jgi:hypothetical protein
VRDVVFNLWMHGAMCVCGFVQQKLRVSKKLANKQKIWEIWKREKDQGKQM